MRDEHHTVPIVVMDEAQHLSDRFLVDLSGFLNVAFDSRDVLTLWLVGLPALRRHLEMQQHAPLAMRVSAQVHLEPFTDRAAFAAFVTQALAAVGATEKIVADPAMELLLRSSRGLPRVASRLLRAALILAHERDQSFVDEHILEAVLDDGLVTVLP
jgi:type II secretory pathway predicted ATPase ExeA